VELAQAGGEIESVAPDGFRADRHALDAPTAIEDGQPGRERLADFTLRVVERATDGAGRGRHGEAAQ
jgi:hypothetical protein